MSILLRIRWKLYDWFGIGSISRLMADTAGQGVFKGLRSVRRVKTKRPIKKGQMVTWDNVAD
jgi:predicted homoserine dehydrogenase-like protein